MDHARSAECTRFVDRARPFRPRLAELNAMMRELSERRMDGPALAVAVVDVTGVRVRVIPGAGPHLLAAGRHPACDLRLLQDDASLRHAVVVADDDGVRLLDLSSSFGLRGRAVAGHGRWAVVRAGDSLIAAVVLAADDATGDVDDLRTLLRLLDAPAALASDPGRACHLSLPAQELSTVLPPPPPPRRRRRSGDHPVLHLDDVTAPLLVGRSERCAVHIDDDGVSRVHAALVPVRHSGQPWVMVVDTGSTNGTALLRVRGGAIHEVPLGPVGRGQRVGAGDMVVLAGRIRIRVVGALRCEAADVAGVGAGVVEGDRAGGR